MRKTAEERAAEKEIAKIEAEKNQKPVKRLTINIEWVKSRTWGHNPHATAEVEFHDGTFTRRDGFRASGCGYDKESTVVADILRLFPEIQALESRDPRQCTLWGHPGE